MPDTYEELDKRAKSSARYRVHRSAKAGIRTFRSTDIDEFKAWEQLCSANYAAHGRQPYPSALYRAVATLIMETDTLRFYVSKLNGQVVGGSVQVFALGQAYYWMSATDPRFRNFGVNDAIFEASFRDAITEGVTSYDFGPSPTGAKGLIRFKEKWGGVQKNYYQYSYANALGRIGANLVRNRKFSNTGAIDHERHG